MLLQSTKNFLAGTESMLLRRNPPKRNPPKRELRKPERSEEFLTNSTTENTLLGETNTSKTEKSGEIGWAVKEAT